MLVLTTAGSALTSSDSATEGVATRSTSNSSSGDVGRDSDALSLQQYIGLLLGLAALILLLALLYRKMWHSTARVGSSRSDVQLRAAANDDVDSPSTKAAHVVTRSWRVVAPREVAVLGVDVRLAAEDEEDAKEVEAQAEMMAEIAVMAPARVRVHEQLAALTEHKAATGAHAEEETAADMDDDAAVREAHSRAQLHLG